MRHFTDPTYLRTIHDGLLSGPIHKDNASTLPIGLIGIYEEALPPASNVKERTKFLEFFAVWALLKKEVSAAFVIPLLEGWTEENVLDYISRYSKWFNSPVSGKYVLYHERIRSFLLQKVSHGHFTACNEAIIQNCQTALQAKSGDEQEYYALEHLSLHLLIQSMENKDAVALKTLAYDTAHWNRQVEISKGFEWSKSLLNDMMIWASKHDDEEVIECALNKVDLYHLEQNDAPRIVELVAQNDIETALGRIEAFGGNDKEGLQRKFILYMLCLMELTLLGSKDKPFRKEAIEPLLKHLDDNLPADHSVLNWNDFFPSYLMFKMACEWAELGLDYIRVYKRTDDWDKDWINENGQFNKLQIEVLIECSSGILNESDRSCVLKYVSMQLTKQGEMEEALGCARNINNELHKIFALTEVSSKLAKQGSTAEAGFIMQESIDFVSRIFDEENRSFALNKISVELAKQGKIPESLNFASNIISGHLKSLALKDISSEIARQGNVILADKVMHDALKFAKGIVKGFNKIEALKSISTEFVKQGKITEANIVMLETLKCANEINLQGANISALKGISIELAKQGKITEAYECAKGIIYEDQKSIALKDITFELAKQGKIAEAELCANKISSESAKSLALKCLSTELAKQGRTKEAETVLHEALKLARVINDLSIKFDIKNVIAIEFYKQNKLNECVLALLESLECERGISSFLLRSKILKEISIEMAQHKKIESAITMLKKSQEIAIFISSEYWKNVTQKEINIELVKLGEIKLAIESARSMSISYWKCDTLMCISYELYKQDETTKADNVMNEVLEMVRSNKSLRGRSFDLIGVSKELSKQGKVLEASIVIQEALECALSISDEWKKNSALQLVSITFAKLGFFSDSLECAHGINDLSGKISALKDISTELTKKGLGAEASKVIQEALECANSISSKSKKSEALKDISIALSNQGLVSKALECSQNISDELDKIKALIIISKVLAKQGMIAEALECARDISSMSGKSRALKDVSTELAKFGNWTLSQNACLEIPQLSQKHNCWKEIAQKTQEEFGWGKALSLASNLQHKESQSFYLKGIVENLNISECNTQMIIKAIRYYLNDIESLQKILQLHALHETFLDKTSPGKIQLFNRGLNIQWAIDIKNSIRIN
jgi:tetratricopeptide (TPR) repeat protein